MPFNHRKKAKSIVGRIRHHFSLRRSAFHHFEVVKRERAHRQQLRLVEHAKKLTSKLEAALSHSSNMSDIVHFRYLLKRLSRLSRGYTTILHDAVVAYHHAKIRVPKLLNHELESNTILVGKIDALIKRADHSISPSRKSK